MNNMMCYHFEYDGKEVYVSQTNLLLGSKEEKELIENEILIELGIKERIENGTN